MRLPCSDSAGVVGRYRGTKTCVRDRQIGVRIQGVESRNAQFPDEDVIKLDRQSDDRKRGLEREIEALDKETRESRNVTALAASLKTKLERDGSTETVEEPLKRMKAMVDLGHSKRFVLAIENGLKTGTPGLKTGTQLVFVPSELAASPFQLRPRFNSSGVRKQGRRVESVQSTSICRFCDADLDLHRERGSARLRTSAAPTPSCDMSLIR
jgi:hypothetical protein